MFRFDFDGIEQLHVRATILIFCINFTFCTYHLFFFAEQRTVLYEIDSVYFEMNTL